jgi:LemA protein
MGVKPHGDISLGTSGYGPNRFRRHLTDTCAMGPSLLLVIGITVVALILVMFTVGMYNRLIALLNRIKNSYAQIDVQLKRRNDLIPNLVETAKGYLSHERGTLEAVIAARNAASAANTDAASNPGDPAAMTQLTNAEGLLKGSLGRLFALSEAYPDLKANMTMLRLMEELASTENTISVTRHSYNDAVMDYNTRRGVFPSNAIAGVFHFTAAESFAINQPEQREPAKVSFT